MRTLDDRRRAAGAAGQEHQLVGVDRAVLRAEHERGGDRLPGRGRDLLVERAGRNRTLRGRERTTDLFGQICRENAREPRGIDVQIFYAASEATPRSGIDGTSTV